MTTAPVPPAYAALIRSGRVSTQTRQALERRAVSDTQDYQPQALSPSAYATLEAVLGRVLPQSRIDLAQRLDRALAAGSGDGWRFDDLPPDVDAYQNALDVLSAFGGLDVAEQEACLAAIARGEHGQARQRWFEDLRGDAVKLYVADPGTLARIGYSGIGYGGDRPEKQGFDLLKPGERAAWEPEP